MGGLCRTIERGGYRFDLGGHRFFTRYEEVESLWRELLGDDLLKRPRRSRILYQGHLFDYPLSVGTVLSGLGPLESARCVLSYARARRRVRGDEPHLEAWVRNRFGDRLFETFFRTYTEKVWGMPCTEIGADWAAQRIKQLELSTAVRDAVGRAVPALQRDSGAISLTDWFWYPRYGPGMLFDALAHRAVSRGARLQLSTEVVAVHWTAAGPTSVTTRSPSGEEAHHNVTHVLSSIPLTVLVERMQPAAPAPVLRAARSLRYRHLRTVNLVLDKPHPFPDQWVYVHDPELAVGRIQNFGAWSPWMLADAGTACVGLEYFCSDGDAVWSATDDAMIAQASRELAATGLSRGARVLDACTVRVPRAYPVYDPAHKEHLATLEAWVRSVPRLQPIGRAGMFKYNNSDHSVLTALLAVENLLGASHNVWAVNTDTAYHEVRPGRQAR